MLEIEPRIVVSPCGRRATAGQGGTHVSQNPTRRRTRAHRSRAILGSLLVLAALLPSAIAPARAAVDPAGAVASGFLYYKYPAPDPLCVGLGLNVSTGPFFSPEDCGFASFAIAGAGGTATVRAALVGPDGTTFATVNGSYDDVNADWSFPVNPDAAWPAGWIDAIVS